MSARARGDCRHELPAADRASGNLQSGSGRKDFHRGRGRGSLAGSTRGIGTGGRRRTRRALGTIRRNVWEDPFLVSRMGAAAVRGFQGDATFKDKKRMLATLKHFTGHGQPESGMNCAPANISERVLRETFFYPFKYALQEAGAVCVMA